MFDTMLESTTAKPEDHNKWSFSIAIGAHVLILAVIIGASYLIVQAVQDPDVMISFIGAAPPPPPPPPPPPAGSSKPKPKDEIKPTPTEVIQPQVTPEVVPEAPAAPEDEGVEGGVEGGVPGGVPGGVVGGVVGGVEGGTGDEPILPTGDVVLPVIIKKVEPSYPDIARRARIEGKVILQAVIDKEGNVNEVTVLSSSNPMFNDSAIDAVKQRKYKPALQNGRPVAIYFTIRVDFRLR